MKESTKEFIMKSGIAATIYVLSSYVSEKRNSEDLKVSEFIKKLPAKFISDVKGVALDVFITSEYSFANGEDGVYFSVKTPKNKIFDYKISDEHSVLMNGFKITPENNNRNVFIVVEGLKGGYVSGELVPDSYEKSFFERTYKLDKETLDFKFS